MTTKSKTFLVAILSAGLALVFLLAYLSQTDLLFGHYRGPSWLGMGAFFFAMVSGIAAVAWFIPTEPKRQAEKRHGDDSDRDTEQAEQAAPGGRVDDQDTAVKLVQGFFVALILLCLGGLLIATFEGTDFGRVASKREAAEAGRIAEEQAAKALSLPEYRRLVESVHDKPSAERSATLDLLSKIALYRSASLDEVDRQLLRRTLSDVMLNQDEPQEDRAAAAEGLNHMFGYAAPATDQLIGALQDPYFQVRVHAVHALMSIGGASDESADRVVPALEALRDDANDFVRSRAGIAIKHIAIKRQIRSELEGALKPKSADE